MTQYKYFGAEWCGPCDQVKNTDVWDDVVDEIEVYDVDNEAGMEEFNKYQSRSLPTLMVLEDGRPVDAVVGSSPVIEELRSINV